MTTRQGALRGFFHYSIQLYTPNEESHRQSQKPREKSKQRKGFYGQIFGDLATRQGALGKLFLQLHTPNVESHRQNQKPREKIQQRKGFYGQNFGELATEGGDGSADDTRGGSGGVPHLPVAQLQEQDQEKLHTPTLGGR